MSNAQKGRKISDRHRNRISNALSGRKLSREHKLKIGMSTSKALAGRTLSNKHKESISNAHSGKKLSPQHIEKIRVRMIDTSYAKGHKCSDERKTDMRNAMISRIENGLKSGTSMTPNTSIYEKPILDTLEKFFNYKILRQYKIAGYFLDGYCPALKLAIEIDEEYHNKIEQLNRDAYRENQIKNELGCTFMRIDING